MQKLIKEGEGHQFEPTPGWCERATLAFELLLPDTFGLTRNSVLHLIAEYEAAQEPKQEPLPHEWRSGDFDRGVSLGTCVHCGEMIYRGQLPNACSAHKAKVEPLPHEWRVNCVGNGWFRGVCKFCSQTHFGDAYMECSETPCPARNAPEKPEPAAKDAKLPFDLAIKLLQSDFTEVQRCDLRMMFAALLAEVDRRIAERFKEDERWRYSEIECIADERIGKAKVCANYPEIGGYFIVPGGK